MEPTPDERNQQIIETVRKTFEPLTIRLTHETESATIYMPSVIAELEPEESNDRY